MSFSLTNGLVLQVRTVCYTPTQASFNIAHYQVTGVVGTPKDAEVAVVLSNGLKPLYVSAIADMAHFRGVGVQVLVTPPVPIVPEAVAINDAQGTASGSALPTQLSGLIRYQSDPGGRGTDGRMFIPFLTSDALGSPNPSAVSSVYLDKLQSLAAEYFNPGTIVGLTGSCDIVLGRFHGPTTFVPFISGTAQPGVATQRRRGYYGKMNRTPW